MYAPYHTNRARNSGVSLVFAVTLLAIGAAGCATDTPNPTAPQIAEVSQPDANVEDENAIVVANSAELNAALAPQNAGRTIRVFVGTYGLTQPLTVPDKVTLEGEGVMLFDGEGLPAGFSADTRTTLTMTANTPGDVLTLGDSVTVRRIAIVDIAARAGNVIGVASRARATAFLRRSRKSRSSSRTHTPFCPRGRPGAACANVYADVLGPMGPVAPALHGTGNRLEIAGNLNAFGRTNRAIEPGPGPEFFTSDK